MQRLWQGSLEVPSECDNAASGSQAEVMLVHDRQLPDLVPVSCAASASVSQCMCASVQQMRRNLCCSAALMNHVSQAASGCHTCPLLLQLWTPEAAAAGSLVMQPPTPPPPPLGTTNQASGIGLA